MPRRSMALAWLCAFSGPTPALIQTYEAFFAACGYSLMMWSGTAFWNVSGFADWTPKQLLQACRSVDTLAERRSGIPHLSAAEAPPLSKADIEPTAANAPSQALA